MHKHTTQQQSSLKMKGYRVPQFATRQHRCRLALLSLFGIADSDKWAALRPVASTMIFL